MFIVESFVKYLQCRQTDCIGICEQFSIVVLHCILAGRCEVAEQPIDDTIDCVPGMFDKLVVRFLYIY